MESKKSKLDLIQLVQDKRQVPLPFETNLEELECLGEGDDEKIDREILTNLEAKDLNLTAEFLNLRRGKLGPEPGEPAILLGIKFNFHPDHPNKLRFKHARIEIELSGVAEKGEEECKLPAGCSASFTLLAPEFAYGSPVETTSTSGYSCGVNTPIFDVVNALHEWGSEVKRHDRMVIQGSRHGVPPTRVVWTLTENAEGGQGTRGLPAIFKAGVIILCLKPFAMTIRVKATLGWRWWDAEKLVGNMWPLKSTSPPLVLSYDDRRLGEKVEKSFDEEDLLKIAFFSDGGREK